jgi:hypothetical protein
MKAFNYLTPCINFFSNGDKRNNTTAATPHKTTKTIKNSNKLWISKPEGVNSSTLKSSIK